MAWCLPGTCLRERSHDPYVGRLATGRIHAGTIKIGDPVQVLNLESKQLEMGKVTKMYVTRGMVKSEVSSAAAGDIITIAGVNAFVSDTICDAEVSEPIPSPTLDPPTISMTFGVNDSPIAGKEGKFLTSSHIKDRLKRETEVRTSTERSCCPCWLDSCVRRSCTVRGVPLTVHVTGWWATCSL